MEILSLIFFGGRYHSILHSSFTILHSANSAQRCEVLCILVQAAFVKIVGFLMDLRCYFIVLWFSLI